MPQQTTVTSPAVKRFKHAILEPLGQPVGLLVVHHDLIRAGNVRRRIELVDLHTRWMEVKHESGSIEAK